MSDAFKLIIEDDEGKRSVVPVDLGTVSIGRLDGNTIRLNERNVSRHHARLVRENGSIYAEDLDSYNGVYINGDRINGRAQIHEGDLLQVGDFQMELRGEGLQRRSEETTQRTLMPEMETTQPEIRVPKEPRPAEKTPAVPAPRGAESEPRAEPTAIIRLDHLQDVEAATQKQSGVIAGQRAKLLCVSTNLAGTELEIDKTECVIGRTDDNDIVVDHRSVSRNHAKIVVSGRNYKILDLGSANGTLVNGEQYAQVDLKKGDLVELGHVKFRFVPPGTTYDLTDEERAAISRAGGSSSASNRPTGALRPDGGGGSASMTATLKANPVMSAAIGGMVALMVVLVAWLVASGGHESASRAAAVAQPQATTKAVAVAPPAPQAAPTKNAEVAAAKKLMAQQQWHKAQLHLELALSNDPNNGEAKSLEQQAESEEKAKTAYDKANDAIKAGDWAAAWNVLGDIPDTSFYHDQASPLREQVRGALVLQKITEAKQAIQAKDWDTAKEKADAVESLDPDRPELADLRNAIADGRKHAEESHRIARASPSRRSRHSSHRVSKPPPRPTPRPAPEPAKQAETAKKASPSADAKALYLRGTQALTGGRMGEAISLFSKCVQTDRTFCYCYRALGIAYARSGNGPKAARYYKLYLRFCPTARDADQVRQLLGAYGG